MQNLLVGLIVASCCAYAVWALMPGVMRRGLAARLLHWPLPEPFAKPLRRAAKGGGSCNCDGCDGAKPPAGGPGQPQPIRIHRAPKTERKA